MPLGAVLEQSSGALKNTLIERIDSIETTLAHIVPEFTANLLIPVIILIYIFTIDWRMGLASRNDTGGLFLLRSYDEGQSSILSTHGYSHKGAQ